MSAVSGIVFLDMHGNILRLSWMKWMKPTMKTNSARLQTLHDSVSCSLNTQTLLHLCSSQQSSQLGKENRIKKSLFGVE